MADRFLIAPFKSGLVKNLPIWQTPEDSFYELENVFIHQGIIKKRFGSQYLGIGAATNLAAQLKSRLRVFIGTTDAGTGNINTAAAALPVGVFKAGQMFSVKNDTFTVPEAGVPVDMLRSDGKADAATFNTTDGTYNIVNAAKGEKLYWYPSEPVMGLALFEQGAINDHTAIAFDTRFAYAYTAAGWGRVGTQIYSGTNLDYFYAANFEGETPEETALFATNYKYSEETSDNMYRTLDTTTWTVFKPHIKVDANPDENIVVTCKMMISFKSHLILFNTYEYDDKSGALAYKRFVNRARYSSVKNPLHPDSFLEPLQAGYIGGGYTDAPTEEEITSVQFVGNKLIVFFERSTYELAYTYNEVLPFIWHKLSNDMGSESLYATVSSPNGIVTVGQTGIHVCNGTSVQRLDTAIPNEIFNYLNSSDAIKRICGVKDYFKGLFYFALPGQVEDDTPAYTDMILVYNYENNTWAKFEDSVTCFGYFEQVLGETWEDDYETWQEDNTAWNDGIELPGHRKVLIGNQQGFTYAVINDKNSNSSSLQISKVDGQELTVIDHNLPDGSYIKLHDTNSDGIYKVAVVDDNTISTTATIVDYAGGGTISRVSKLNITSTAWNPYMKNGKNVSLSKLVFGVVPSVSGQVTVRFIPSQSNIDSLAHSTASGAILGNYKLETFPYDLVPLEETQSLLWHAVYLQSEGNSVSINITLDDAQIRNENIAFSNFEIQGIILETSPTGEVG